MHCPPCEICPISDVCIQSVTSRKCPIEEYEESAKQSNNIKKENN